MSANTHAERRPALDHEAEGAKKTKPPNPHPVGKAGFEVWVFTKGGLVSVHHCRLYCTVVHVHRLGRYVESSGACVYRYGPVTKSKLSYYRWSLPASG